MSTWNFHNHVYFVKGRLQQDFLNVLEFLKKQGCQSIGSIGTCWGSYPVIRMSSHPDIKAGISMHPSHAGVIQNLGEDEENILKQVYSRGKKDTHPTKELLSKIAFSKWVCQTLNVLLHPWPTGS